MNLIILGPQGSGKGTQAQMLTERKGFVHLEMGRILRSVAKSDNKYAEIVRDTINSGALVPDEYTRLIAWDFVNKHEPKTHSFVIEGYPRTIGQYEQVKDMLAKFGKKLGAVINIEISEDESVRRLSGRRTCSRCGEVYNLVTNPPPQENTCQCGGELIQREDDKPDAIKNRLRIYRDQTHPVFEQAVKDGVGWEIDGERPIEDIYQDIITKLGI